MFLTVYSQAPYPCSLKEGFLFSPFNFQDKYVEISHSSGMDALYCKGPRFLLGGKITGEHPPVNGWSQGLAEHPTSLLESLQTRKQLGPASVLPFASSPYGRERWD